jgi:dipeptidase
MTIFFSSFVVSFLLLLLLSCLPFVVHDVTACSDLLVTPGASSDSSAMIAYNADDVGLWGVLYHYPRQQHNTTSNINNNTMVQIYDWDSGRYLGEIPQSPQTYNVVGNGNEYGLVIGESTFGGVVDKIGPQEGAIIDYGSLIYLTLQRAKTAVEAIHTMSELMDTYGYASEGESISIADANGDVWIMEVIGRGTSYGKLGGVWVARKVPDGYVTAHANQARITTFPRDDPDNCLFADDVVNVAVHYGLYDPTTSIDDDSLDFSFSDVYDPVTFTGARFSEARVWSMFSQIVDPNGSFRQEYAEYATGRNLTKRMPLFVQPHAKLSLDNVMHIMTSHYEGTELDATIDVGAGLYGDAHRPRPLTWDYDGKTYFHERPIATERTGWNFIAQIRPSMPRELAALIWFAVDDSSTSPRVPVYASSTKIAHAYAGKGTQDGVTGPLMKLDMTKAFWVQNMVSNLCYWRWRDAYPFVRNKIDTIHADFQRQTEIADRKALELHHNDSPAAAVEFVTQFSVDAGKRLHEQWLEFYGDVFVRFRDFSVIVPDKENTRCGCDIQQPGLTEENKKRIITETGSHYEIPNVKSNKLQQSSSTTADRFDETQQQHNKDNNNKDNNNIVKSVY